MAEPKAQQIQSSQVAHRPLNQGHMPSHMTPPPFLSLSERDGELLFLVGLESPI